MAIAYENQSCLCCGRMHTKGREFCSDRCRNKHWREEHRAKPDTEDGDEQPVRRCEYIGCNRPLPKGLRPGAKYCSAACRQAAYRDR